MISLPCTLHSTPCWPLQLPRVAAGHKLGSSTPCRLIHHRSTVVAARGSMQAGVGLDRLIRRALQTGGAGPKQRSRAGDFTMKFGMVVMAVGLLNLALPEVGLKAAGGDPASASNSLAVGSAQTLGLCTFVIGWFNYLGGKADAEWFLCGGILDRLAAYLVVVPLALLGRIPMSQFLAQTVLDLGSALYTWKLYSEDQARRM